MNKKASIFHNGMVAFITTKILMTFYYFIYSQCGNGYRVINECCIMILYF